HEAVRQLDPDLPAVEELEQRGLVGELGTRRVAEAVALAAVAGLEAVLHRDVGRIGDAPRLAELAMEALRGGLGGLDRERLERVAEQVLARVLELLRARADALAGGRDEHGDRVARRRSRDRMDEVREAEPLARDLAGEREAGPAPSRHGDVQGVP